MWREDNGSIVPTADIPVKATMFKSTATMQDLMSDTTNVATVGIVAAAITGGSEYVYTRTETDNKFETITAHNNDKTSLQRSINQKANAADVYDKTEIDSKVETLNSTISEKADADDVYDKTSVDSMITTVNTSIAAKANSDDVYTKSQTYTKTEVDNKVNEVVSDVVAGDLSNYYTKAQTDSEIAKLTTLEFQHLEIDHYEEEWDEEEEEYIEVPIYKDPVEAQNKEFWDTESGAKVVECVHNDTVSGAKWLFGRIFIHPIKSRLKTACLAATGALVGTKLIAQTVNFGTSAAVNIKELGGDDDPGNIAFEDDYHGNRTVTNMVHSSEYDSMTYQENNDTKTLAPDTTIPTVLAVKDHHYTKAEVDELINNIGTAADLKNYYTKTEADDRYLNTEANPARYLAKEFDYSSKLTTIATQFIAGVQSIDVVAGTSFSPETEYYNFTYKETFCLVPAQDETLNASLFQVVLKFKDENDEEIDDRFSINIRSFYTGTRTDIAASVLEDKTSNYMFDVEFTGTLTCLNAVNETLAESLTPVLRFSYQSHGLSSVVLVNVYDQGADKRSFKGTFTTTVDDYMTTADTTAALLLKADKDTTYTKSQVDDKIADAIDGIDEFATTTYVDSTFLKKTDSADKLLKEASGSFPHTNSPTGAMETYSEWIIDLISSTVKADAEYYEVSTFIDVSLITEHTSEEVLENLSVKIQHTDGSYQDMNYIGDVSSSGTIILRYGINNFILTPTVGEQLHVNVRLYHTLKTVVDDVETDENINVTVDVGTLSYTSSDRIKNYYTKPEVDDKIALKANAADTYNKTQTDGLLLLKADTSTTYTKSEVDALIGNNALSETTPISYMGTLTENICTDKDFSANGRNEVKTWSNPNGIEGPYFSILTTIDTNCKLIGTIVNQSTYSGFTSASVQKITLVYQNDSQSSYTKLDVPFTRSSNTFTFSYTMPSNLPTTIYLSAFIMATSTSIAYETVSNTVLKAKLTLDREYPGTVNGILKDYIDYRIAVAST